MDALILSCSTGGGHNAAARAIKEEMTRRGHNAVMLDPYRFAGNDLDKKVANGYIKIAQKTPRLFGAIYGIGNGYRRLPIKSPVYAVNKLMFDKMKEFLENNHFDVILTTHLYPGEILTNMKEKGFPVPPTVFVATDYVCIPFTEELSCDWFVTPSEELNGDFVRRGIDEKKLFAAGIPVSAVFNEDISKPDAAKAIGLDPTKKHLLLSGGSIGGGMLEKSLAVLDRYLKENPEYDLTVICGNNESLKKRLSERYGNDKRIFIIASTNKISLYMKASEAYLSKPGGLSSTEAAVSQTPLIHISPIPGCENKNMKFFEEHGMSIAVGGDEEKLQKALEALKDENFIRKMKENQKKYINGEAASDICDLAEEQERKG